jgi:YspA, cpYpsA-related SLOG family
VSCAYEDPARWYEQARRERCKAHPDGAVDNSGGPTAQWLAAVENRRSLAVDDGGEVEARGFYRILVTGSRTWKPDGRIAEQLTAEVRHALRVGLTPVIVHGDCPRGADYIADKWAAARHVDVERHPADWDAHGKAAGFRRDAEMVALGAHVCLAFIRDASRGATRTADLAEKAGIPTRRYTAGTHDQPLFEAADE